MQNLYRKGFPVELIGAGCVPPKSCSGCVGVRAFPGQGGSRVLAATLFCLSSDVKDPKWHRTENQNGESLEMCA